MRITEQQLRKAEQTIRVWKTCTKSAKLKENEYVSSVEVDQDGKFTVRIKKYEVKIVHSVVNEDVPF